MIANNGKPSIIIWKYRVNSDLLPIKNLSIFLCTCVIVALRHSRPKVAERAQIMDEEQNWTTSDWCFEYDGTREPPVKTSGRQHRGNDQSRIGAAGCNQVGQCVLGTKLTFGCVHRLQTLFKTLRPNSIKNHIDFLEAKILYLPDSWGRHRHRLGGKSLPTRIWQAPRPSGADRWCTRT